MADCRTQPSIQVKSPGDSPDENEELKLKEKYPNLNKKGINSVILQKRLNKGHKYFDSGDYNMARAKVQQQKQVHLPPQREESSLLQSSTGDTIPTPENVPAVRRKSLLITDPSGAGLLIGGPGVQQMSPGSPSASPSSHNLCEDTTFESVGGLLH